MGTDDPSRRPLDRFPEDFAGVDDGHVQAADGDWKLIIINWQIYLIRLESVGDVDDFVEQQSREIYFSK